MTEEVIEFVEAQIAGLNRDNALDFFRNVLHLYYRFLPPDVAQDVLNRVIEVMRGGYFDVFVENKLWNQLPFRYTCLVPQFVEVILLTCETFPNELTPRLIDMFYTALPDHRKQCMAVLAEYAKHFEEVANPWSLLDVLFLKSNLFRRADVGEECANVMLYLYENFEEFREERGKNCWNRMCELLNVRNDKVVNAAYAALCRMIDVTPDIVNEYTFPTPPVVVHLRDAKTLRGAVSLLFKMRPRMGSLYSKNMVKMLLEAAGIEEKACALLVEFASDLETARIIADEGNWMATDMPDFSHTVKLFSAVMKHAELRADLVEHEALVSLLIKLVKEFKASEAVVCKYLRKLPLNEVFVQQLSESGFLEMLLMQVMNDGDEIQKSALMLTRAIASITYVKDLVLVSEWICRLVTEWTTLGILATKVACELVKYPECVEVFKDKGIVDALRPKVEDPAAKQTVEELIAALE